MSFELLQEDVLWNVSQSLTKTFQEKLQAITLFPKTGLIVLEYDFSRIMWYSKKAFLLRNCVRMLADTTSVDWYLLVTVIVAPEDHIAAEAIYWTGSKTFNQYHLHTKTCTKHIYSCYNYWFTYPQTDTLPHHHASCEQLVKRNMLHLPFTCFQNKWISTSLTLVLDKIEQIAGDRRWWRPKTEPTER